MSRIFGPQDGWYKEGNRGRRNICGIFKMEKKRRGKEKKQFTKGCGDSLGWIGIYQQAISRYKDIYIL